MQALVAHEFNARSVIQPYVFAAALRTLFRWIDNDLVAVPIPTSNPNHGDSPFDQILRERDFIVNRFLF
jgi:hypothetical protein